MKRNVVLLGVVAALLASAAFAGTTGKLSGTVADDNGLAAARRVGDDLFTGTDRRRQDGRDRDRRQLLVPRPRPGRLHRQGRALGLRLPGAQRRRGPPRPHHRTERAHAAIEVRRGDHRRRRDPRGRPDPGLDFADLLQRLPEDRGDRFHPPRLPERAQHGPGRRRLQQPERVRLDLRRERVLHRRPRHHRSGHLDLRHQLQLRRHPGDLVPDRRLRGGVRACDRRYRQPGHQVGRQRLLGYAGHPLPRLQLLRERRPLRQGRPTRSSTSTRRPPSAARSSATTCGSSSPASTSTRRPPRSTRRPPASTRARTTSAS